MSVFPACVILRHTYHPAYSYKHFVTLSSSLFSVKSSTILALPWGLCAVQNQHTMFKSILLSLFSPINPSMGFLSRCLSGLCWESKLILHNVFLQRMMKCAALLLWLVQAQMYFWICLFVLPQLTYFQIWRAAIFCLSVTSTPPSYAHP